MKTILVPTDFSECANNAVKFAAFIAKKTGASINLLHVLEVPSLGHQGSTDSTIDDIPYMVGLLKATKTRMRKIRSLPYMKGINAVHNIEIGGVHSHITAAAEKYKADMIVMGTHGASGLQEIFIGSNAEKIVRNSEIPVISVKEEVANPKIEKIVFATDFSEETELVLPTVEKFAELLGAKIEIVKVVTVFQFETTHNSQQAIKNFESRFKKSNYATSIYYDWNKQGGIRRFADTSKADIIALGTHGKHGLSHFFNNRIAESLVNHSSLPVLTINFHRNALEKQLKDQGIPNSKTNLDEIYFRSQIPAI